MANVKRPFIRSVSIGNVFKRRRNPYQPWQDEDSLLDEERPPNQNPAVQFTEENIGAPLGDWQSTNQTDSGVTTPPASTTLTELDITLTGSVTTPPASTTPTELDITLTGSVTTPPASTTPTELDITLTGSVNGEGIQLTDCFYLGSYDMTGMTIRGRGCIDFPAGYLWENTQENTQRRRKNSLPTKFDSYRPKYVRLIAGKNDLQVFDCYSNNLTVEFGYNTIAFVGTHPKHTRLFAFIAQAKGKQTPFCHAFKCEDKESASTTANTLSNVFQKKVEEMKTIQIGASVTVVS